MNVSIVAAFAVVIKSVIEANVVAGVVVVAGAGDGEDGSEIS